MAERTWNKDLRSIVEHFIFGSNYHKNHQKKNKKHPDPYTTSKYSAAVQLARPKHPTPAKMHCVVIAHIQRTILNPFPEEAIDVYLRNE